MTKHYYTITGGAGGSKLYYLTEKQQKEFKKLDADAHRDPDKHEKSCEWIEKNGKLIGPVECFAL
jgi:hypothetical protein